MGSRPSIPNTNIGGVDAMIQSLDFSVVCGIEIKNMTKHNLHSPKTKVEWGYLVSPPTPSIAAGKNGSLIGHKNRFSATGTTGVLSYLIGKTELRMVVMWAAPYNFDFSVNYLAVGFIQKDDDDDIYNRMYYETGKDYAFCRDKFFDSCNLVEKTRGNFTIQGIMGTSHKAKVDIELNEERSKSAGSNRKPQK